MNKINKLLVIGLIFVCICTVSASLSAIYSNIVSVSVQEYNLSLNPSQQTVIRYQNATFVAKLTLNGHSVQDATIYLYYDDYTPTGISNTTDPNGECILTINMTEVGEFKFMAQFGLP